MYVDEYGGVVYYRNQIDPPAEGFWVGLARRTERTYSLAGYAAHDLPDYGQCCCVHFLFWFTPGKTTARFRLNTVPLPDDRRRHLYRLARGLYRARGPIEPLLDAILEVWPMPQLALRFQWFLSANGGIA